MVINKELTEGCREEALYVYNERYGTCEADGFKGEHLALSDTVDYLKQQDKGLFVEEAIFLTRKWVSQEEKETNNRILNRSF